MAERLVRAKRLADETIFSYLPLLLKLPTKDVIKSSALSKSYRNIWKEVPGLDLDYGDFPDINTFVSFVDKFLSFDRDIRNFKLEFEWDEGNEPEVDDVNRWIGIVVKRKVEHLRVWAIPCGKIEVVIPPTVYTCESLVSLELSGVTFANPPDVVSLPFIKTMVLDGVLFADNLALEMLISSCPVLESLTVTMNYSFFFVTLLRVCSKSLLRFTYTCSSLQNFGKELVVEIDAPKLQYLKLFDFLAAGYIINSPASLVEVDIYIEFNSMFGKRFYQNYLKRREHILNFLIGISGVQVMNISSRTLEIIYNCSRFEPLPTFGKLSHLHVNFKDNQWEMLPAFIQSCPNLKSLELEFNILPNFEVISKVPEPHHLLPSLKSVKIVKSIVEEKATEMKLVSFFLENSPNLKEFAIVMGDFRKNRDSVIIKKLLAIPKLSSSCQVSIL